MNQENSNNPNNNNDKQSRKRSPKNHEFIRYNNHYPPIHHSELKKAQDVQLKWIKKQHKLIIY